MSVPPLLYSPLDDALYCDNRRFDLRRLAWRAAERLPGDAEPITSEAAARWALKDKRVAAPPVGVIGPRDADHRVAELAHALGGRLADLGFAMICGGRSGAMEAVCKGFSEAGGRPIGILPGEDWSQANPYVGIPIATGVGEARNAIIACASFALVAVGGGYGTLSEMALGLRLKRLVIALPEAHPVAGAVPCTSIAEAIACIVDRFLGRDGVGPGHRSE